MECFVSNSLVVFWASEVGLRRLDRERWEEGHVIGWEANGWGK